MDNISTIRQTTTINDANNNQNNSAERTEVFNRSCVICYENQHLLMSAQCRHLYCITCLSKYLKEYKTCAYCRENMASLNRIFQDKDGKYLVRSQGAIKIPDNACDSKKLIYLIIKKCPKAEIPELVANVNQYNNQAVDKIDILFECIKNNDVDLISSLIECGADYKYKDENGNNYLHGVKNLEVAKLLVKKHPNLIYEPNQQNQTPLHIHLEERNDNIVDFIMENHKDIDEIINDNTILDTALKNKSLRFFVNLVKLGINTDTIVEKILAYIKNGNDKNGFFISIIKELNIDINLKDKNNGDSFLHLATSYDAIEGLILQGADINQKNNDGNTPLHTHIANGSNKDKIMLLVKNKARLDIKNNQGDTAIELALKQNNFKLLDKLQKNNYIDFNFKDHIKTEKQMFKYVLYRIETGEYDIAKEIITSPNFNINIIDPDTGNNLLHEIKMGDKQIGNYNNVDRFREILDLLIKQKINKNLQNKEGNTPLHYQIINNYSTFPHEITSFLIKNKVELNLSNNDGKTVLDITFEKEYGTVCEDIVEKGGKFNYVMQNDMFSYVKREYDGTDRFITAIISQLEDVNILNLENGNTLLHEANKSYEIVESLIKKGANINVQNTCGDTPLHLRVAENNTSLAEVLIDAGANTELKNKEGKTILDIADTIGNRSIIESFIENKKNRITMGASEK